MPARASRKGAAPAGGSERRAIARAWLDSPLGRLLSATESAVVEAALGRIFGFQLLQVGTWGDPRLFLAHARTSRCALISSEPAPGVSLLSDAASLGIAAGTVDAVLLPHTLEMDDDPHEVLREVDRVLAGEGHLITLGFNPVGLWGLRRFVARRPFPAGIARLISERRMRDWLALLGLQVQHVERYFYRLPLNGARVQKRLERMESLGARFWPLLSGGYMLVAKKRLYTLTPVRPLRHKKPVAAGAIVETT